MFLHLCVILFTGHMTGGSALGVGVGIQGARGSASWWGGGLGRLPPKIHVCMYGILQDTINKWAVHILLECILVAHLIFQINRRLTLKNGNR